MRAMATGAPIALANLVEKADLFLFVFLRSVDNRYGERAKGEDHNANELNELNTNRYTWKHGANLTLTGKQTQTRNVHN